MSYSLLDLLSGQSQAGILLWFPLRKTSFLCRQLCLPFKSGPGSKWGTRGIGWSDVMCLEHSPKNKMEPVPQECCLPRLSGRESMPFASEQGIKLENWEAGPQSSPESAAPGREWHCLLSPPGEREGRSVSAGDGDGWKQCAQSSRGWTLSQAVASGCSTAHPSDKSALLKEGE